ncbi:MAG: hypothetical protein R2932_29200 [Caldilineaceae bacterium]
MSANIFHTTVADFVQMVFGSDQEDVQEDLPDAVCWSAGELGQALTQLAHRSSLPLTVENGPSIPSDDLLSASALLSKAALDRWVMVYADQMGLEAEPLQSTYADATAVLTYAAPALLQLPPAQRGGNPRFVAILRGGSRQLQLVARDGSVCFVRTAFLRDALWTDIIGQQRANIATMLQNAGIAMARQPQVQQAILREVLGAKARQNGWLLRVPPRVGLWQQAQQSGLVSVTMRLVGGYFAQLLLTIGAWWMIGESALVGHFDLGWLLGWAMLLLTTIPFQAWMSITQSELAIGIGTNFKQRLLYGVMQLDPEEIRHQGAGQFLGRVLAADTVEQLGLASGFVAVLAFFQLAAAAFILAMGIGGWFHALLLLLWVAISIGLSFFYLRRSHAWVDAYREMTNDLVERMVGHRTRLAQEGRDQWHLLEDQILNRYVQLQRTLDQVEGQLKAVVPRGWMVIGVGGVLYALLFAHPSPTQLAISFGGSSLPIRP